MQRRLLTLLLVNAGASVSIDRVIDVLWEGAPPPTATKGLHTYMSRLRRALGQEAKVGSGAHGYRLEAVEQQLDVRRFDELAGAGRQLLEASPDEAAVILADALELWRGAAYGEFAGEDFARPEAVRLEDLRLAVTEDWYGARLAAGDTGTIPGLTAFVTANPLRERPHAARWWYGVTIMDIRMQVTIEERDHRRARDRAATLGISLAEYVRRLVRRDLTEDEPSGSACLDDLIGIADSGGSDVAAHQDDYLGEAVGSEQV